MNKHLLSAAVGALLGVGVTTVLNVSGPVSYFIHAVDLRASRLSDGGVEISRQAYATAALADGGSVDVGGKLCPLKQDETTCAKSLMENSSSCFK